MLQYFKVILLKSLKPLHNRPFWFSEPQAISVNGNQYVEENCAQLNSSKSFMLLLVGILAMDKDPCNG